MITSSTHRISCRACLLLKYLIYSNFFLKVFISYTQQQKPWNVRRSSIYQASKNFSENLNFLFHLLRSSFYGFVNNLHVKQDIFLMIINPFLVLFLFIFWWKTSKKIFKLRSLSKIDNIMLHIFHWFFSSPSPLIYGVRKVRKKRLAINLQTGQHGLHHKSKDLLFYKRFSNRLRLLTLISSLFSLIFWLEFFLLFSSKNNNKHCACSHGIKQQFKAFSKLSWAKKPKSIIYLRVLDVSN